LAQPPAIEPVRRDGKTTWFDTAEALRRILGPAGDAADGVVLDLANERAKLAKAQELGQRLKNEATSGATIPVAKAEAIWANYILTCKERLRAIPNGSLTRIAGMTKPMARELSALIDEALSELADGATPRQVAQRDTE
jgi:phage terminase Nu1 subunit (DNA packaging protein)